MALEMDRIAREVLGLHTVHHACGEHREIRDVSVDDLRNALQAAYRAGEASSKRIPTHS